MAISTHKKEEARNLPKSSKNLGNFKTFGDMQARTYYQNMAI